MKPSVLAGFPWMEVKPMLKTNEEEVDFFPPSPKKESSIGLMNVVSILVIFMAGAVLGMIISAHFNRCFNSHTELFFPSTTMNTAENCEEAGMKNFARPCILMHSMTDKELIWRASMVPKVEEFPFDRVPKVAFLFLTRGPPPFSPLWDQFFKGYEGFYSVYLHTIPGYKFNVSEDSAFYGRKIPSQEIEWGSISMLDAEKRLLANALLDFSNERFVLLSESCIPLFNFLTVYKYLTSSTYSYVQSFDKDSTEARGRHRHRMEPDIKLSQWRKGSQWFELSRELAVSIVADYKYHSIFRQYCKPTCYPDEHYIPTYLNMFHGDLNANRSVTWVDWSRGGAHPAIYGRESVAESFIQSMRNKQACMNNLSPNSFCFLFARKFAPSALEPLLDLASTVMEF